MQAGLRWRADVFLFLKWVWLSRLDHRVDSGDTPPPVRVLRSLDRVFSRCKTARALAAKPLTGCKSRLGHPRFRKTGRAAPLPFLIKQATHSPYFRTSPGAGVGLGGTRTVLLGRHLRSCRCLPAGCGAGCVRHRRRRPRPGAILLGLGSARAVVLLRRLLLCGRHAGAHEQRHARQDDQMLPHDAFLFSRCCRNCRS
jgi:hypothetical protein